MMMKKTMSLALAILVSVSAIAGCGKAGNEGGESSNQVTQNSTTDSKDKELPVVRIAAVPGLPGVPSLYLSESGLDEKYGFKADIQFYASGIPMNEALAAGLWDAGPIGAAAVTSLAMYDAKLVADMNTGLPGLAMIAPADSEIADVSGKSTAFPEILGDADSVRGKKILTVRGAMMHYLTLLYLDAIGLTENEVELIHMEQSQLATAFKSGQADIASMGPPSATFELLNSGEAVELATFPKLDNPQTEVIVASNDFYENNYDLLVRVVAASLEASDALISDKDLQKEYLKKWYVMNGQEVTEEQLVQEVGESLVTSEEASQTECGKFVGGLARFNAENGMLEEKLVEVVDQNIKQDVLKDALELILEKK